MKAILSALLLVVAAGVNTLDAQARYGSSMGSTGMSSSDMSSSDMSSSDMGSTGMNTSDMGSSMGSTGMSSSNMGSTGMSSSDMDDSSDMSSTGMSSSRSKRGLRNRNRSGRHMMAMSGTRRSPMSSSYSS